MQYCFFFAIGIIAGYVFNVPHENTKTNIIDDNYRITMKYLYIHFVILMETK